MIYIVLNAVPIGVATLLGLLVGYVYQRAGARGRLGIATMLLAVVALAWFAAILAGALILAPPRGPAWVMAIGTAIVIWAGFVLPAVLLSGRFRGLGWGLAIADAGWWLGVMVVQAAVMTAIGLVPPPG